MSVERFLKSVSKTAKNNKTSNVSLLNLFLSQIYQSKNYFETQVNHKPL